MNAPVKRRRPKLPPEAARIRPVQSLALVRLDEKVEVTDGGIHIPQTAQTQPKLGTVMAVGPGRWCHGWKGDLPDRSRLELRKPGVEVGQRVVIGPYNGYRIDRQQRFRDDHQWWIVETLPSVGSEFHPGDIYMIVEDD